MLEVTDPDIVTPNSLATEGGISTLRAGALGDLAVALDGSAAGHGATTGLTVMSGLMSDEYDYSGTFPTRREADTRLVQNTNFSVNRIYSNIHRARAAAVATTELAEEFGGANAVMSEMQSVVGYTYTLFAETFCSGVPFSKAPADGGDLEFGEPLTTEQMLQAAVSWFDQAIGNASGSGDLASLAQVGKARALLGLGDIAQAASTVSGVPTSFVYNIEHSTNSRRQENGIYVMTTVRRQFSVADGKGGNGIMYRSAMDPRVPWDGGNTLGQDDRTPYFNQLKYPSSNAPVPLASGIEARLIEAEAAVQANNAAAVQNIHNALRATVGLDPVDLSGMTQDELLDFHFTERAFWLYSTGHRQGDLRRLVRVWGQPVESVFPWGTYFKGGQYSTDVTFPVPESEANNPKYAGCLDRNP
ncbi:MAG: RagB/SusD family nutrient uptake outer membrane protein [Gemmatimonadota bacterium]